MREEFPIFKKHPHLIYLDTAATAQKPQCVIDALVQFYSEDYATVHRAVYSQSVQASQKYYETRQVAAAFLNAEADEIVFTKGTTDAINLIAQSFGRTFIHPGDEILISEMEHHSNFVPWQMIAKERGAILKLISVDERGCLQWEGKINAKTKIVSLAHVSNVTGTINPIKEIAEEAHRFGARLFVDGAQAAPHMKIDVQNLGCDFYAFSGHKCYGPTGVGVLFGKAEELKLLPPVQGGGDMIASVEEEKTSYQSPPFRFEAGTPQIGSVIALKSALEFTQKHLKEDVLLPLATERLLEIPGLKIIGQAPQKGPILTFVIEGIHPLDAATFLDLKGIAVRSGHMCAQPLLKRFGQESALRASFGMYNTKKEVDLLIKGLEAVLKLSVC